MVASPTPFGAKFAHPARPVIALVGDGAMQMNIWPSSSTVDKYWKRWADPRWIVRLHDQDLNEVTWEKRVMEGNPRSDASQDISDFAYAELGRCPGSKVSSSIHRTASPQLGRRRFQATARWSLRSRPIRKSFLFRRTSR